MEPVFHLSISVSDLDRTRRFYEQAFGAKIGRRTASWIDIWLFGIQLTAYQRPGAVTPSPFREAQHFGATVAWSDWPNIVATAAACAGGYACDPVMGDDRAKAMVADPDGYLIELKAYADISRLERPAQFGNR